MYTIKLDISDIENLKKRVSRMIDDLEDCYTEVSRIAGDLDMKVRKRSDIDQRLSTIKRELMKEKDFLADCERLISDSINEFVEAEKITRLPEMNFSLNSVGGDDVASGPSFTDLLVQSGLLTLGGVSGLFGLGNILNPLGINSIPQLSQYLNSGNWPGFTPASGGGDEPSLLAKFANNQLKTDGNLIDGEASTSGELFGINSAASASGGLFHYEAGIKNSSSFKFKDENGNWNFDSFGLKTSAAVGGALAVGAVSGNIGYLHGEASGEFLTAGVSADATMALYNDGKFRPSLSVGASAEASVLSGEAEAGFGTDQYGIGASASGDLLHAEAEAEAGIGYLGEDENGNATYGVQAEASAMASLASGKVEGGITLFGIDINVGLSGHAGAVGVEAGGSITTEGVKANFAGAAALGAGLDISIDWSDAEWVGESIDAVGEFASDMVDTASDVIDGALDAAGDFVDGVGDFLSFDWL